MTFNKEVLKEEIEKAEKALALTVIQLSFWGEKAAKVRNESTLKNLSVLQSQEKELEEYIAFLKENAK